MIPQGSSVEQAARPTTIWGAVTRHPTPEERDERVVIPLDLETALRGLLAVKPDEEPQPAKSPKTKKAPAK